MRLITNTYIVMAFDSDSEFADESYEIEYDKHKLKLKTKQGIVHNLITQCLSRRNDLRNRYTTILSFLGELSWLYKMKINLLQLKSSIQAPTEIGAWVNKTRYNREKRTTLMDIQVAKNDYQKLALGLYREAISANSFFYGYFCYCKIIMMLNARQSDFANWVNTNINNLVGNDSKFILNDLRENKKVNDIGKYLYHEGRCALAHADVNKKDPDKPILKPFDYEDMKRVMKEHYLVKELAEIFINEDLKVLSWKEALAIWKD